MRVAQPDDAAAVTDVLSRAYPALMAPHYDPAVLAAALPFMTRANPGHLASGTYYVQEVSARRIVACGGWTHTEPGTNNVETGIAHIRHFGTHPDWTRKGLASRIFARCKQDALAAGIRTFRCYSSLGAEPFYASLGFHAVERVDIALGGVMKFSTVTMVWTK